MIGRKIISVGWEVEGEYLQKKCIFVVSTTGKLVYVISRLFYF